MADVSCIRRGPTIPSNPPAYRVSRAPAFNVSLARVALRSAGVFAMGVMAAWPTSSTAVGLGPITQQSALGQSLRIVVPVILEPGEDVAAECFKLTSAGRDADGVTQVTFGRVAVERASSGTRLVVTSSRPVNDPVLQLTLQAGCDNAVRREYTLLMDPPAIDAPVVAVQTETRIEPAPPPRRASRPSARARQGQPRGSSSSAATTNRSRPATSATSKPSAHAAAGGDQSKAPPKKPGTAAKTAQGSPPRARADQPRLEVSSAIGGASMAKGGRPLTAAEREKAQQELADNIEAETAVLQHRIVELTAQVERMQRELASPAPRQSAAGEEAKVAAAAQDVKPPSSTGAAPAPSATTPAPSLSSPATPPSTTPPSTTPPSTTPPSATTTTSPAPESAVPAATIPRADASPPAAEATPPPAKAPALAKAEPAIASDAWWEDTASLIAVIVAAGLVMAGMLLWKRQRDAARDELWHRPARVAPTTAPTRTRLRNPAAGVLTAQDEHDTLHPPPRPAELVVASEVLELSQVADEARVYVDVGLPQRAIEVLSKHIRKNPRTTPAAWMMLLDLHHANGHRQDFRRLADEIRQHFNVQMPLWEGFAASKTSSEGSLDTFPHVAKTLVELWRKPGCREYLERLLHDTRDGKRMGFPLAAYSDILMLLQVLEGRPAAARKSEPVSGVWPEPEVPPAPTKAVAPPLAPAATEKPVTRKPMPPEHAPRTAPKPIAFEVDVDPSKETGAPRKPRA